MLIDIVTGDLQWTDLLPGSRIGDINLKFNCTFIFDVMASSIIVYDAQI